MPKNNKQSSAQAVKESLLMLTKQIEQSFQETSLLNLKKLSNKKISNIISCGMGGSNLHLDLIKSVYEPTLKVPLILNRDYHLPGCAGKDSLIIVTSYSGGTEETISCFKEAMKLKAKIFVITGGGELLALARKHKISHYRLNTELNPSDQPRYGVGLQIGTALALLSQLRLIKLSTKDLMKNLETIKLQNSSWGHNQEYNMAHQTAMELGNKIGMIIGAEFLSANAHILSNQINESAKNLAIPYVLPELNHHLLEGLALPKNINKSLEFVFLNCSAYSNHINKRVMATQKVLQRQNISYLNHFCSGKDHLACALELLAFGSWVSYYLSELNGVDPNEIPWVKFFKAELKK